MNAIIKKLDIKKAVTHKTLLLILGMFFLSGCSEQKSEVFLFSFFKDNGEDGLHLAYSEDGYSWEALNNNKSLLGPIVGKDKLMRDPCIIKGPNDMYHMIWTVGWNERGIGYAYSKDLIHWSEQKYIPVMEHEMGAKNCWAPELFYDSKSKQYLIYWSATISGRFPETGTSGDKGYNHRMYYCTTLDFETFSETKLWYDQGFNVIDGTLHKIKDTYTLFLKNETVSPEPEKNIRIATSTSLTGGYSKASEPISDNWVEGPTAIQTEKGWIVYYDQYTRHKMGAIISQDLKQWKDISHEINFPEGTRHGTVFKAPKSILNQLLELDKMD